MEGLRCAAALQLLANGEIEAVRALVAEIIGNTHMNTELVMKGDEWYTQLTFA